MTGWFDRMDRDNDGSAIDDAFSMGTGVVGAGLMGLGGMGMAAGAGLTAIGAMEGASILGIPTGAATVGAGALLGLGGAGVAGLGGLLTTGAASNVAEEAGDFTADLFGTRGAPPFEQSEDGDPFYLSGRTDGLGQQLHDAIFGPAEPKLADVLTPAEPVAAPK
jgi:hypothetical protein